jgi:methionyl-tRNA synthetase
MMGYLIKNYSIFTKQRNKLDIDVFMKSFRPDGALGRLWDEITLLDRSIHEDHPWTMSGEELKGHLILYIQKILEIADNLEPFLPDTAAQINEIFNRLKVTKPPPLFVRKKMN